MFKFGVQHGSQLVKLARKNIESFIKTGKKIPLPSEDWLLEKRGVFTTLKTYPHLDLRGCIGYPLPVLPLGEALLESSLAAAFDDPRFPPLTYDAVNDIVVEVSVLAVPVEIKAALSELPKYIEIGKHGLIVEYGYSSGLLLPQVPEEVGWTTPEEFLSGVCNKAGLLTDCWKKEGPKFSTFEAEVFYEVSPNGEIVRK